MRSWTRRRLDKEVKKSCRKVAGRENKRGMGGSRRKQHENIVQDWLVVKISITSCNVSRVCFYLYVRLPTCYQITQDGQHAGSFCYMSFLPLETVEPLFFPLPLPLFLPSFLCFIMPLISILLMLIFKSVFLVFVTSLQPHSHFISSDAVMCWNP